MIRLCKIENWYIHTLYITGIRMEISQVTCRCFLVPHKWNQWYSVPSLLTQGLPRRQCIAGILESEPQKSCHTCQLHPSSSQDQQSCHPSKPGTHCWYIH